MKKLTTKQELENQKLIIDLQAEVIDHQDKTLKSAFKGWKHTLDEWKRWSNIGFVTSLLMYISGIFLGVIIGGLLL